MRIRIPVSIRKWLFLPPILLGAGIFAWLMLHGREPQKKPAQELARVLRVIEAPSVDVVPRVLGYGTAKPVQVWRAVAEVEGRVVEVHPELKAGAFVKAGEVVLRIDPREYELAVSRLESEIAEIEAKLAELTTQEENDRASLEIEESSLQLAKADFDRVRDLIERNMAAPTEVRDEERTYLAQRQKVQALQNSLNLVPKQRNTLRASLAVRNARLEQARLDLQKTVIHAPFDCRLADVQIEKGQFLKGGEILFEANGTEATEVDAQVSIDRVRNLLPPDARAQLGGIPDMARLRELFDVEATVRMRIGDFAAEWPARFVRLREQIDPDTRTLAVVVAVDDPYERAIPGQRPPLVKGMFCEVELRGQPLPERVVIPRAALHEDHVYVVDADNRLQRRAVNVLFAQSDFLCIDSGLEVGDRVVVSDPTPAIEGMLVDPVEDGSLEGVVLSQARSGTGIR
jgi:RND family efflux transporter MFP subunit